MKKYTVEELNEILRLHGLWVKCDAAGIKANLIGANLSEADLSEADLSEADLSSKIVSMLRIGSRKDMTTYNFDTDEIFCGCFKGTLKEFEAKVKETHKDNPQYLKEYLGAIKYFESLKEKED